jgi:hypothetical protein
LYTGLLVGTTDITAACISQYIRTGKFPDKMLLYIAGGILGLKHSMTGGVWTQALGLLCHYIIAMSCTVLFFLAYPRLRLLRYNPYIVGLLYGAVASSFMSFVVLPLTPLPQGAIVWSRLLLGWAILGVVLGIPVALSAKWFYAGRVDIN